MPKYAAAITIPAAVHQRTRRGRRRGGAGTGAATGDAGGASEVGGACGVSDAMVLSHVVVDRLSSWPLFPISGRVSPSLGRLARVQVRHGHPTSRWPGELLGAGVTPIAYSSRARAIR